MQVRPAPAFDFEEATPDVAAQADPSLLTGKDIYEYMQMNRKARFSNDEVGRKSFKMMMDYMDTKKTDFIGSAENAVNQMIEELGGLADAPLNPAKFAASTAEGAAKGAMDMWGIFAHSEDPGSWGFKLKSYFMRLAGKDDGDTDSQIRQFHEARDFNNRSYEHMEGKGTILGDYLPDGWKSTYEGLVDPKFATALSYAVLDIPEWFFSAGASTPATALKLAANASAKSARATWAARAVERLGGFGTNIIGKGMDVAAGKTLEAAGAIIRAPFKAIYGAEAAAMQLAGDYAGNAVRNATTAAAVEMGAEVVGTTMRHPAMGFMRSIGLEALGELAQTAGADIVDRALGKAMVKPDAIGMTTLERLSSGTARGADVMSREAQLLAVGVNATVGWATSMSGSALKAMFRDGVIGAGIGWVNSREEGAGAGVGMGVAWGGLSGTVRHMGAYTRFQHQDQLVVDNFKSYGVEAFRRVLGPTGYESAKRFSEHIQGYGDLRTSAIEMAHLQTLIAHEGGLMGVGNVNFYFGDVAKNPNELAQILVDMKMKPSDIQANVAQVSQAAGAMIDFKDALGGSKKVLVLNSERYRPTTGRHEVAHLLLRSVAEANGDMEYIRGYDPASQSEVSYKIFRPNYLLNLLGATKDMGIMPDKALNAMVQSYTALKIWNDYNGIDEATARQVGMTYANAVETFRDLYSKNQLKLQDPEVVKLVASISTAMEEAFAYYHGGLTNVLPVDQYTKDPAARNMLRAWAENRAARKNSLIMADLEMAGVEIKARLTNPDGTPRLFSDQKDATGAPVPVFDSFLFDDGKMLRTPGMDAWIDMVMRQAYSKGEVLTSTMDQFRQEALAKSAGKTHLFNSVAGGGMRLKPKNELDDISTQQAQKILGAAGSVPEDVRPLVEVDQDGATKIKLESISADALDAIKQSGAFTKQEWDAMMGMINIVQRNRQGAMTHNVLNATLLAHTMQVRKGASVIRLTGKDVPVTYRSFVPLSVEIYVKTHDAQGNPLRSPKGGVLIHSLDVAAENRRLQKIFKRADVQQLFSGNFEEFVKVFNSYVINQSGLNGARVPTAELFRPMFGSEAERVRDIMYEAFGGRKTKDSSWINEPANGYKGGADDPNRPFFTMRFDTMADIQVQPTAWNPYSRVPFFPYIHNVAYEGVTKNFQLTGFAASPLANGGMMFRNRQGFEIFESRKGYALFDPFGIKVGVFKTAAKAMKKAAKDAGEIDEADTIPDNAVYDNNPHGPDANGPEELTSLFMVSGRVEALQKRLRSGVSASGLAPADHIAQHAKLGSKYGHFGRVGELKPGVFEEAEMVGVGLVEIVRPDGTTHNAQSKSFIRYSEAFGTKRMSIDDPDVPSEDPLLMADRFTTSTAIGGGLVNVALSFNPVYLKDIQMKYGPEFAADVVSSRAAAALVLSTSVRKGEIPFPSSGNMESAKGAMELSRLMADRSEVTALGEPTNYHEQKVDAFVKSGQNDMLRNLAAGAKKGSSSALNREGHETMNTTFRSSVLSIRTTFGTLDWAKKKVQAYESGVNVSEAEITIARTILATVYGSDGESIRADKIDFESAFRTAHRIYGTEQNEHAVGMRMWRFNRHDNPDKVAMFQDAMVDLSKTFKGTQKYDVDRIGIVREIEAHHKKFLENAKASASNDPAIGILGPWDPFAVRTNWINNLSELIPGLGDAVSDVILSDPSRRKVKASAKAQSFLDAWHDAANRVADAGGVYEKTVIGSFGTDGRLQRGKSGKKKGFAWMQMSKVDDPDVDNVLTHKSIYEGIEDAIKRHSEGDKSALQDAAILYGTIARLTSSESPFFHLIKPAWERDLGLGGPLEHMNRSVFESAKEYRRGGGVGSISGVRQIVRKPASVYDLPAARAYITAGSKGDNMVDLYVQSSVNTANPSRYRAAAKANSVIGSDLAPVVVTTRSATGSISMAIDNGSSLVQGSSSRDGKLGLQTMAPDSLGADNLRARGTAMDLSESAVSPAALAIAMGSMDASGNFDFSRQINRSEKDLVTWMQVHSNLGQGSKGFIDSIMQKMATELSVIDPAGRGEAESRLMADVTKLLTDNGVGHEQAMFAERMIMARFKIAESIAEGYPNGPMVLSNLAAMSDAVLQSNELKSTGMMANGASKSQLGAYGAMIKTYRKEGHVELKSRTAGGNIETSTAYMLVGRRAEAYLSKERKDILTSLGLVGKLRDASGREHTYFEISDARASLNTATFTAGLVSPLVEGLPDAALAIEGAVLSRIGQQNRADLDSLIDNFNRRGLKLKDIIVHDELFSLYPELAKLDVTCIEGMSCAFDPTGSKGFVIGVDNFLRQEYAANIDMTSKAPRAGESMAYEGHGQFPDYESNFRDVVLHEIQHSIQNAEDWRDAAFNASVGRYASAPGLDDPKFTEAMNPEGYLTPMYVGAAKALGSDQNIGIMGPFEGDNSVTSDVVKMLKKYFAEHEKLANVITRDTGAAGIREAIDYASTDDVMRAINAIVEAPMAKVLMADEIPSIVRHSERFETIMDLMELALSKRASEFDAEGMTSIKERIRISRESNRKIKSTAIASMERVKQGSDPLMEASALSGVVQQFLPHVTITDPSMSVLARDIVGNIDYVEHMQDFATAPLRRALNKLAFAAGNNASTLSAQQANLRIAEVVHGLMKNLYMQDPMEVMARETEMRTSMTIEEMAKAPRKTFAEVVKLPEALRVGLFTREMVGAEFGMNISPGTFNDFKNDTLLMIGGSKGSSKLSSEVLTKDSRVFELGLRHLARASLLTHHIKPDRILRRVNELAYESRGWKIDENGRAVYVISEGTMRLNRPGAEASEVAYTMQNMLESTIGMPRRDNPLTPGAREADNTYAEQLKADKAVQLGQLTGIPDMDINTPPDLGLLSGIARGHEKVTSSSFLRDTSTNGDNNVLFAAGLTKDGVSVTIEDLAEAIGATLDVESQMTMGSPALDAVMGRYFPDLIEADRIVDALRIAGVDEGDISSSKAQKIAEAFAGKKVTKAEIADLMAIMHDVPFFDSVGAATNRDLLRQAAFTGDADAAQKIRAAYFESGDYGVAMRATVHGLINNSAGFSSEIPMKGVFDSLTKSTYGSGVLRLQSVVTTVIKEQWNILEGLYGLTGSKSVADELVRRLRSRRPNLAEVFPDRNDHHILFNKETRIFPGSVNPDNLANEALNRFRNRVFKHLMALTPVAERVIQLMKNEPERSRVIDALEHIYGKVIDDSIKEATRLTMSAEEGLESSRTVQYAATVGSAASLSNRTYGIGNKEQSVIRKVTERTMGGYQSSRMSGVVPFFGVFGGAAHAMREFARIDSSYVGMAGIAMQGDYSFGPTSGRQRNLISMQTEGDTFFRRFIRERDMGNAVEDYDMETSLDIIADAGDLAAASLLAERISNNLTGDRKDTVKAYSEHITNALRSHRRLKQVASGILSAIDAQAGYMGIGNVLTPSRLISSPTDTYLSDTSRKRLARLVADDHVGLELAQAHIGEQRQKAMALLDLMRAIEEDPGVMNPFGTLITEGFNGDYDNQTDAYAFRLMPHATTLRSYIPGTGDRRLVITSAHEALTNTATAKDVAILSGLESTSSSSPAFASGKYAAMDYNLSANLFGDRPGEPIGSALARLGPIIAKISRDMPSIHFADTIERVMRKVGGEHSQSYKHNRTMRSMMHMAGGGLGLYYAAENMAMSSDPATRALGEALKGFDPESHPQYKNNLSAGLLIGSMVPLLKRISEHDSLYEAKAPILELVGEFSKLRSIRPDQIRPDEFVRRGSELFSGSTGIGIRRLSQYIGVRYADADWQGMARVAGLYVFDSSIAPELAKRFNKAEINQIRESYIQQLAMTKGRSEAYEAIHFNASSADSLTHRVTAEMRNAQDGSFINRAPDQREAQSMVKFLQEIHGDILGHSDYGAGTEMLLRLLLELSATEGVKHSPSAIYTDDGYKVNFAAYSDNADASSRSLPYDEVVSNEIYSEGSSGFQPATGATIYGPGSKFTTGEVIPPELGGIAAALLQHPSSAEYMTGVKARGKGIQTTFNPGKDRKLTKDLVRTHLRKTIAKRLQAAGSDVIEIQPASMSLTYRAPSAAHLMGIRGADTVRDAVKDWHATGIRAIDKGIQYKMGEAQKGNYITAGSDNALVDRMFGPLTGFAESTPSRGFSWSRAANGDILVNISGDHLGYKMDGRAFGRRVGFGFSIAEGVGYDPNSKAFIPAKAQVQAGLHQIMSSYGHFMLDAYDPNSSSMASAYMRADEILGGRIHRSRTDAVTPTDLKENAASVRGAMMLIGQEPDLARHVGAAQRLSFGQSAGYITIRIPANASMETVKQMLLTAHLDPAITPNYGILGSKGRFEGTVLSVVNNQLFGNYGEATGSYSTALKHKLRGAGNNVIDVGTLPEVLVNELTKARQAADPHLIDDIELLVARIMGGEQGYFLPDAERKLSLDGDTGMAIATLFPGREDLLKYSWDAKAMHGIKVWKRTGPKGDANFRAHVVQFDSPVSITPEGGLLISKTAVAFKSAAEAEQYANRMSKMMSGAEMVKALADGDLEVVDRSDLSKSKDAFIGELTPRRQGVFTEAGLGESANGFVVGDLDMVMDQKTAQRVAKALDSRKHIRFKANDTLLMVSGAGAKVTELEALVRSKLNFGLPKGPISLKSRAMNAIARGVDQHKRYKESMNGADWFAFMKINGVSGEELRQSGLGQLFSTSMDTPLTRMDVAEFFAAMMPNLVKNDFRFSPQQRAIEAMTMGIPQNPGSNLPAFIQKSGWHIPYIQNAAIQTVANMKMSIDAVRGPIEALEIKLSEANAKGDAATVTKLTAALDVIRQSATATAERLGMDNGFLEGASVSTILRLADEKLRSRLGEEGVETSTSSSIARLAADIDFQDIESVRQKYNDEVAKLLKDQEMLAALEGVAPEIYAPLRLMTHGWIGATKPELGLVSMSNVSRAASSKVYGFGGAYAESTGQVLGNRSEGWDSYSTGRQQMGTNTVVQFYDAAKQDEINQYIEDLQAAAAAALNAGDNEKHKAARALLAAAERVATVRAAMSELKAGIGAHFGDYLPSRTVEPYKGEYEIGHYRYSLNLSLAGLSLPIFDKPDALLIGPDMAGLPNAVRLERLGFPVMMMEEFQSDLFQKFAGTGMIDDVDAFLPATAGESTMMANVPKIKELKERVGQLESIRDNATKHMLENLFKVTGDMSFTDLTIRLQLNNLDLMNKMFITASAPGFFKGTGRFVNTPDSLKRSIKAQAGFDLPDRMPVTEPDVELIKLVMMSNGGSNLTSVAQRMVKQRMLANMRSAAEVHELFSGRGMNIGNITELINNDPRRAAVNSYQSIQQLIHKANVDMMSDNYLSRVMPSLENAPEGDLKELLKGLHSHLEHIERSGSDSKGLLATQLAAIMLLDEKFVLEASQSVQTGMKIDYENVARRALETIRAKFADTKSFNGKTIMTSLEVMLQQAAEPKPTATFANGFSNGVDLGFDDFANRVIQSDGMTAEQLANIEAIPLEELLPLLGLSRHLYESAINDLAWQLDSAGDVTNKAVFIERGPGPADQGPQRTYITMRADGASGLTMANRIFLEILRAKKEGRALGHFIFSDYDRYSGTQAGSFARSIGELFKAMISKQNIQPEIDRLNLDIATMSKGVPETGSFEGARRGGEAVMPNALPFVDINGYKSGHLSMAVIDSMNHGMRAIGMYDATFQLERGHGLNKTPTLFLAAGKANRFVWPALGIDESYTILQGLMYAHEKLGGGDINGPSGPHAAFIERLNNMSDGEVAPMMLGVPLDHNGVSGSIGTHIALVFKDLFERMPEGMRGELLKSYGRHATTFELGGDYMRTLVRHIDSRSKEAKSRGSAKVASFTGGKKAPNENWNDSAFKFNANAMKESGMTMIPQNAHGSAGWGYVTNYGMPGWKVDMMMVGAGQAFKNLYSLDAFERPQFEVRGSNMVLLDPKTGRELATVDVSSEQGMRIFREKYLQASKYKGGNWAINAFMKEWGAAGGYIDMTTLADLPGYREASSGYSLNTAAGMGAMAELAGTARRGDPMADAILAATAEGKLSPMGFNQTDPFGGTPNIRAEDIRSILTRAGAHADNPDAGRAIVSRESIDALGVLAGDLSGNPVQQADDPKAMPSAQSFFRYGLVNPYVYALVMGKGTATPEAMAHTILRIRNPIVATFVHTPEMRTREHEVAFRNKISTGVNLLMASGQRAEPGKPVSPELISALAQLADKVQAAGMNASRRSSRQVADTRYRDLRDSTPITYADNLMVDRKTLPELPMAEKPAEVDPSDKRARLWDREVATELMKQGHSDLEIAKHLGVSRTSMVLHRAAQGIAPLPEGSLSKRDNSNPPNKLTQEEVTKRMDKIAEGLAAGGSYSDLVRKSNLTDSKRKHGGWKPIREYIESKGVSVPKQGGNKPRKKPGKVEPSPSDSLSAPTHEAQVREAPNQSKLMKREQLEGDMNG